MLRTNLATRPFYNERAVRAAIAVVVLLAAALSAFNALQVLSQRERNREFIARAETAEARAGELRTQARAIRQTLDRDEVNAVQAAAREANLLIERRAFSWTDLFNRFEETLPADVRIVAVQPQVDERGRMLVVVTAISRGIEHLDAFIDRLELTGAFAGLLSRQEVTQEDGTLRSVIQGYYNPSAAVGPPSSDSGGGATSGNRSTPDVTPRAPKVEDDEEAAQVPPSKPKPEGTR